VNRAVGLLVVLALALPLSAGTAQTASQLLVAGVVAYEDFDFAQAARLLGRAVALEDQLPEADLARALTYLGAAELFRERLNEATVVFHRLLLLDPRQGPDSLRFPPRVRQAFEDVRQATKALAASLPGRLELMPGRDTLTTHVYASSFHEMAATIERDDGTALRVLYSGPIRDSLTLPWDGRGGDGTPVSPGRYRLILVSRSPAGAALRALLIPLEISGSRADTLPDPRLADSLLLPERTSPVSGLLPLAAGAAGGGLIVLLPRIAGAGPDGGGGRFMVVGALGLAGIAGLVHHGLGRPIPANVAANTAVRRTWREAFDRVQQENARLRSFSPVVIQAGAPVRIEGEPR
jgi:hypothetical protein